MKMKHLFFALLITAGFVALSAQAYDLVFKSKAGCPAGQVRVQDTCVSDEGSGAACSVSNCPAPSACLPNGE